MTVMVGTLGQDRLHGWDHVANTIIGREGDDFLYGGHHADFLEGDGGNDHLYGGAGNDTLLGGAGDDILNGGPGADLLVGGAGSDTADYSTTDGTPQAGVIVSLISGEGIGGDAQGDVLFEIENLIGTNGSDILIGNAYANVINAGEGGYYALDQIFAGAGNDIVDIGNNAAVADGGVGTDLLVVNLAGAEEASGWTYFNFASGGSPTGATYTGFEQVEVIGSRGDDTIIGGDARDYLRGGVGADTLVGGAGHDSLRGGDGDDRIIGGWGNDFMVGGKGSDSFVFDDLNSSRDRIIDFQAGAGGDKLEFTDLRQDVSQIHSFSDLLAHATDTDQGVYIDLAGDLRWPIGVILQGVHVADLTADNLDLSHHDLFG